MISIIIPAYNEEKAIGDTIFEIRRIAENADIDNFEIIVVDDGSMDKTSAIAEKAGAKVVRHLYNLGYGRSLKDGIMEASFDTVLIIDADMTYSPESIPALLRLYQVGYHLVIGQRHGKYYEESWLKSPLRHILRLLVEFTAGQKIPDINSGLRVFSRTEILSYYNQLCNTFSFTTSQTLAYLLTGKLVAYLPIEYRRRVGNAKVKLFKDSCRTLQYIVQAVLYYNPLKIFLLLSIGAFTFGVLSLLVNAIFDRSASPLIGTGAVLISFVIFSLGLISDQLRQVLLSQQEVKNAMRKSNLVKAKFNRQDKWRRTAE